MRQLIPAMVTYVNDHGGYVTKTKLLKLLYLFDVEYYRRNRRTFTDFTWKFFHLGPWAREFDPILDELVSAGVLLESQSARPEYDTKFLKTESPQDFSPLFSNFHDESALRTVLGNWAESTTGEILDYVYFRTEPMEHGIRNEPLDFSVIPEEQPETYTRPASGASPKQIAKMKEEFASRLDALRQSPQPKPFGFTPPTYDEEFREAVAKLDASE
ncbi:MAG TPA: hypothetical protein VKO18_13560 [Terriglobia bacterium]|nr:hypothetical protein [Terriglobia bacterium]